MLALGLQDRLVGTAYLDDQILPEFAAAYQRIPVLAAKYPSREVLLAARPDFLYAAYPGAFGADRHRIAGGLEEPTGRHVPRASRMRGQEPSAWRVARDDVRRAS